MSEGQGEAAASRDTLSIQGEKALFQVQLKEREQIFNDWLGLARSYFPESDGRGNNYDPAGYMDVSVGGVLAIEQTVPQERSLRDPDGQHRKHATQNITMTIIGENPYSCKISLLDGNVRDIGFYKSVSGTNKSSEGWEFLEKFHDVIEALTVKNASLAGAREGVAAMGPSDSTLTEVVSPQASSAPVSTPAAA